MLGSANIKVRPLKLAPMVEARSGQGAFSQSWRDPNAGDCFAGRIQLVDATH